MSWGEKAVGEIGAMAVIVCGVITPSKSVLINT
jgi:hypothetical protein